MGIEQEEDFLPWIAKERDEGQQKEYKDVMRVKGSVIGANCFISPLADIYDTTLHMGDDCVIGARALIRSAKLTMGSNCSINSYAYLQGKIVIGNDVRIAPKVNIIADNHLHGDIFQPITVQGNAGKGIVIGDDTWIGAGVTIVDGVHIGSHSIVAAGSVVTKEVGDYVIVGGNPARVLKNRIEEYFAPVLKDFTCKVRSQLEEILESHKVNGIYEDNSPGNQLPIRAACDAAELRAMLGFKAEEGLAETIRAAQKDEINYGVLCMGYALEVMNSTTERPWLNLEGEELLKFLEKQEWNGNVWGAGDHIDCLGTAMYQNERHFGIKPDLDTLFNWLDSHANQEDGMWGKSDRHNMVNGFYRLTRGTYAQFNHPLPYPERTIDTILEHAADESLFGENAGTSCDVLDIIHPLWLCKKQTYYRYAEGREIALRWIKKITENWVDRHGFAFELCRHDDASLMGTEMWISILYYLCDYVGITNLLDYEPKGVHRTGNK